MDCTEKAVAIIRWPGSAGAAAHHRGRGEKGPRKGTRRQGVCKGGGH